MITGVNQLTGLLLPCCGYRPRRATAGGFLYLIPNLRVETRTTGPHPLCARELTTPHPEGLTTRLVPVEVDLKQQIFDVCSSLNNGHSPKGRLRQLCAKRTWWLQKEPLL